MRLLLLFAIAGLAAPNARSAPLFEQPPDPGIHAGSSSTLDYYGKSPGRRNADDFVLLAGGDVNEVLWWGQHAPPSSGKDSYTVTFYADANGAPGAVLQQGSGRVESRPHASIKALTEYRIVLCHALSARPGVRYWISIFNDASGAAWRWNNSMTGNNISMQSGTSSKSAWMQVPGTLTDASFRLGTAPISIWERIRCNLIVIALAGVALALGAAFLWRRRRT